MDHHDYTYCPNPHCPGRTGPLRLPHASRAETGTAGICPHCSGQLRASCPRCDDRMTVRPRLFCPVCGADLLNVTAEVPCRICGSPATGRAGGKDEVPVCSERCLAILIRSTVGVCDQCGMRFITGKGHKDEGTATEDTSPGDFCSDTCRMRHLARERKS